MFAGIDVASERHMLARLDAQGVPLGKPVPITENREGYDTLLCLLGPPPVLVAMEATGHYWKNLYVALVAAGHSVVLLNPLKTRRFQVSGDMQNPSGGDTRNPATLRSRGEMECMTR